METFMKLLETIQTFVWGPPTLVLLMGTGLYFTYKLRGIQICKFPRALKSIFEKEEGAGDVSPFATLCTTLAADIGTGSIVVWQQLFVSVDLERCSGCGYLRFLE